MFSFDEISAEDARHVLWYFADREHGSEPGSFTSKLLSAAAHADSGNLHRLAMGFPGLIEAVRVAQYMPNGLSALVNIAEGRP